MSEIFRAYKYRLKPDAEQQQYLADAFGCARFVWNKLVENFNSWSPDHKPANMSEKTLKDQEELNQDLRYTKDYGQHRSEENESNMQPPDFMNDEWLNSSAPDFELIHNGLQYEELKIRRDFYGPEAIALPNGDTIQISPN